MCLGIPGKVLEWSLRDPLFGKAIVEFSGYRRECCMACVPHADVGSYVIVHAGIAICSIQEDQALQTLADLSSLPELKEESLEDFLGLPEKKIVP
ncbi:MAG: HypC/HybG/HupF family hydrogenase formation chaperone [Planctomycetota bacterium]